jgi:hypothetical protein
MVALGSPCAHAQTGYFATWSAELAYTDNLYDASSHHVVGRPDRLATAYATLSPGLGLYHDSARARYLLGYSHGFTFYLGQAIPVGQSDTGSLRGLFLLSPLDELTLELDVARAPGALLYTDPKLAGRPLSSAHSTVVIGTLLQSLSHEYSANWTGRQSSLFRILDRFGASPPEPLRFEVGGSLGAEYRLERNAWGLDATASYYHALAVKAGGTRVPPVSYLLAGPLARWRRDLSAEWSSILEAGVQMGYRLGGHRSPRLFPTGGAEILWRDESAMVSLAYSARVTPDVLTNRVYYAQSLSAAGRLALIPKRAVSGSCSGGVSQYRTVDGTAVPSGSTVYTWWSTVGVDWAPASWALVALSYLHMQQFGGSTGATSIPGFYRNLVMLSVHGRFPTLEIGEIPTSAPERVDEADRPPGAPELAPPSERPVPAEDESTAPEAQPTPQAKEVSGVEKAQVPASAPAGTSDDSQLPAAQPGGAPAP